jgi:hypothetical protein
VKCCGQLSASSGASWLECACPFDGASAFVSGGSLLGNHHLPWEFTGVLRPRWRCQHRHSGVFSRMNTCSGRAAVGTVSSQHRPLSHVPAHMSAARNVDGRAAPESQPCRPL